ncbi:hypothetical protein GCM10027569_46150 [Flindersiella endophytica]
MSRVTVGFYGGFIMLYDCPECGLPATVTTRGRFASTAGPVEHVQVRCADAHHFLGPADTLRVRLPLPQGIDD